MKLKSVKQEPGKRLRAKKCPFCGEVPSLQQTTRGPMIIHMDNNCLITVVSGMSKIRMFSLDWWNDRK